MTPLTLKGGWRSKIASPKALQRTFQTSRTNIKQDKDQHVKNTANLTLN